MKQIVASREQRLLLDYARRSIVSCVTEQPLPALETSNEVLCSARGCFVTITANGDLRGCIGTFTSDKPLYRLVQEMAVSAAVRDPRFYPMQPADLQSFSLEISILSPLHKITSVDEIQVGAHGIYLEKNYARGVLLPQVATDHGWDRDTFLEQTCLKAGLRPHDWQEGADIHIFSAQIIRENK